MLPLKRANESSPLDFYSLILETIDMRSFSNLWYWIALAVLWSTMSHFVLGIPFDLVLKAKSQGSDKIRELEMMAHVNITRTLEVVEVSGVVLTALWSTLLSVLFVLGVFYGVEFAQAVLLMLAPVSLVLFLSYRRARKIRFEDALGQELIRHLSHHRNYVRLIGMVSVMVTGVFGMYQNMVTGPLGG